jgi:putative Holliday junction resolvase
VAVSDALRITANPLTVLDARDPFPAIEALVDRYRPSVIVVGLPIGLSGREGPAAESARVFGEEVASRTGVPVEYVDERFTTRTAEDALLEGGVRRARRRTTVDKVAASVILQQYLQRRPPPDADEVPPAEPT